MMTGLEKNDPAKSRHDYGVDAIFPAAWINSFLFGRGPLSDGTSAGRGSGT